MPSYLESEHEPAACCGALAPPVGGTFHFEILFMAPLTKTCPKMVLSHKGGSLCVKDVFAKKFFGVGRDSAGGALASVLRKHSSEGRTPDAVERCVRHGGLALRIGTCRPDSETAPVKANSRIYRATDIRLRATKPTPKTCYTSSVILGLGVSPMRRREFIALLGSSA